MISRLVLANHLEVVTHAEGYNDFNNSKLPNASLRYYKKGFFNSPEPFRERQKEKLNQKPVCV